MSNEVKNNIDFSKNQRTTNLLTALDKAFDELNISTIWTALGPKEVQYNCCSSCIFGSSEFENKGYKVTYNIQDLDNFRESYRENIFSSDRKSTRLNSSHPSRSRMPSSA